MMKPGKSPEEVVSGINDVVARYFDEIADLLKNRSTTDFRIAAYRRGAIVVRELLSPVDAIFDDSGREGLEGIPGLGRSLALSIEKFLQTGLMPTLELLRGNGLPPRFMRTPKSPRRRRVMQDRHPVTVQRTTTLPSVAGDPSLPSIGQLLSIDAEYREKAANDKLVRIAPGKFNPTGAEWLPILHARRNEWHYTAAFSNTAHAHEAGMTDDWVIIHRDTAGHSGHWTVITSKFGELKNHRFVRGREEACLVFYRQHPQNVLAAEDFEQPSRLQQKLLFDMG